MKSLFYCFLMLVIEITAQQNNVIELPPASITKDIPVGRIEMHLIDKDRVDIASPSQRKREFNIHIWYPSVAGTKIKGASYISGLDSFSTLVSHAEKKMFLKTSIAVHLNSSVSKKQKYPVVLLSPGFGLNKAYYSSLCYYLVQHQYVVIAIDHSYLNKTLLKDKTPSSPKDGYWDTFPATKPATSVEEAKQKFQEVFAYFNQDIDFILDQLEILNKGKLLNAMFEERLDLINIAHLGHSAGALVTKALMSKKETSFQAFVTFDVRLDQEFLSATEQVEIPSMTQQPILMFALEYVQQYSPYPSEAYLKRRKSDFRHITLKETKHNAMTDLDYIYYREQQDFLKAKIAEKKMLEIFKITSNFLDMHMK